MSFQVDPSFKQGGSKSRERQAKRRVRRLFAGAGLGVALAATGLAIWLIPDRTRDPQTEPEQVVSAEPDGQEIEPFEDDDFAMTPVAASGDAGIIAARAPFIDLPKDPMILNLDQSGVEEGSRIAGPAELPVARVGVPAPDRLALIRDDLVLRETRLVTTIPSSRQDLAYFQAQRSVGMAELGDQPVATAALATRGDLVSVDGADGSWGELIQTSDGGAEDTATYVETQIENTTSVALLLRQEDRRPLYEDTVIILQIERSLTDLLTSGGLSEAAAEQAAAAFQRLLDQPASLPVASVVAIRTRPDLTGPQLLQMSLYDADGYIGTLAQVGAGRFERGADPWAGENLVERSDLMRPASMEQQDVRLLDAIYSAAIRNGLSTTMVGELIVLMSQAHDLDRFAAIDDRLTILFAPEPGPEGQGAGQILYAGVRGPSGTLDCYIFQEPQQDGHRCYGRSGAGPGGAQGGLGSGLIVPVSGTRTSGFGPRMHPILRQLRNHNGVDWAAPTGTPVLAAADGRVSVAGVGGGYGNVVYIDHSGNRQTRYAHLDGFAPGIRAGVEVQGGQLIGYVGTTGRSTGPHLHFELHVNGTPVDPLTYSAPSGGVVVATGPSTGPPTAAVEALVNQIIMVESAGQADAANPRSTALGLGQFIESTWLRMMENYRPDLAGTMSRAEILALRTNPELSREMVTNLARENEAFLRARGHQITPGRLYLAHFLGPGGAHTSLSAAAERPVVDVMGAAVVNANPFLRGRSNGDMWAWADRKMRSAPATSATYASAPAMAPTSPEVRAYIDLIEPLISEET